LSPAPVSCSKPIVTIGVAEIIQSPEIAKLYIDIWNNPWDHRESVGPGD